MHNSRETGEYVSASKKLSLNSSEWFGGMIQSWGEAEEKVHGKLFGGMVSGGHVQNKSGVWFSEVEWFPVVRGDDGESGGFRKLDCGTGKVGGLSGGWRSRKLLERFRKSRFRTALSEPDQKLHCYAEGMMRSLSSRNNLWMIRGDDSQIGGKWWKRAHWELSGDGFQRGCVELANKFVSGNDFGWFGGMIRDQGGAETVHEMRKYANFGGDCSVCLLFDSPRKERWKMLFPRFFVIFPGES